MIERSRLHFFVVRRRGLTLIPVLSAIVLLSIFMGLLVQRQVRSHLAWRTEVRKAVARNLARSERDRLIFLKSKSQKIVTGKRVVHSKDFSDLTESATISIEPSKTNITGYLITIQIPSGSTSNFVSEALEIP
jgi:hypothetical protein